MARSTARHRSRVAALVVLHSLEHEMAAPSASSGLTAAAVFTGMAFDGAQLSRAERCADEQHASLRSLALTPTIDAEEPWLADDLNKWRSCQLSEDGKVLAWNLDATADATCEDRFRPRQIAGEIEEKLPWKKFVSGVKKVLTPGTSADAKATFAKVAVWLTASQLVIAFPPAVFTVTLGVTALGFLISAVTIYAKERSLDAFKRPSNWCALFAEVGQNLFIGSVGGLAGVPALLVAADVFEAVITNLNGVGCSSMFATSVDCQGMDILMQSFSTHYNNIRNQRTEVAYKLLEGIPWTNPWGGSCSCSDCKHLDAHSLCSKPPDSCMAYRFMTCELQKNPGETDYCSISRDCYDSDAAAAWEALIGLYIYK